MSLTPPPARPRACQLPWLPRRRRSGRRCATPPRSSSLLRPHRPPRRPRLVPNPIPTPTTTPPSRSSSSTSRCPASRPSSGPTVRRHAFAVLSSPPPPPLNSVRASSTGGTAIRTTSLTDALSVSVPRMDHQRRRGCARTAAPTASSTACRPCSPARTPTRSARGNHGASPSAVSSSLACLSVASQSHRAGCNLCSSLPPATALPTRCLLCSALLCCCCARI